MVSGKAGRLNVRCGFDGLPVGADVPIGPHNDRQVLRAIHESSLQIVIALRPILHSAFLHFAFPSLLPKQQKNGILLN